MPASGDGKRGSEPGATGDAVSAEHTLQSGRGGPQPIGHADTLPGPPISTVSAPRLPQEGGEVLGNRYEILGELGRGGEGVVFRARDLKADSVVALKLLQHEEGSEQRLLRFRRELQMARRVTHPNVVRIHDLIELPGRFGLSMELVEGEALDHRIARGPLPRDEVVRLAIDLARALAAAHAAGVTHRDLKPANVLLRVDGHAVVTDFGISRAHGAAEEHAGSETGSEKLDLTREGAIIGTPQYMAPEQLEGRKDVGPAADVYAFGAVVFEAATGARLHDATTIVGLRRQRMEAPAPPLRARRPDLPRPLCDAVDRALAREVRDRFPGGVELRAALEPLASPGQGRRAPVWLVVALVALAGSAVFAVSHRAPTPAPPPTPPQDVAPAPAPLTPPLALHVTNVHRVTFGEGCEEFPSFTPDGQGLVYDGTAGRDSLVYRLELAEGATPQPLTHVRGWDLAPRVSPDGERIVFQRMEEERTATYLAPLDGHVPPRLLSRGSARPSWSLDGRAVWTEDGGKLVKLDADTGAVLRAYDGAAGAIAPLTQELSDGSLVGSFGDTSGLHLGGIAVASATGLRWLLRSDLDEVLAVSPDGRHVITSRSTAANEDELVDVPLDGSPVVSLSATGIVAHKGFAATADGKKVAWSTCKAVPHLTPVGTDARLPTTLKTAELDLVSFAAIPGSQDIAAIATRRGPRELWILDIAGQAPPRAIPVCRLPLREIAVSPDGSRFVVAVEGSGLHVGALRGDPALRRVTSDPSDVAPGFRKGGAQIVFTRQVDGRPRVTVAPVDGGDATPLLEPGTDDPAPSPVDDRLAFLAGNLTDALPMMWDGHTGARRPLSPKLLAGRYSSLRFSLDGKRVGVVRGDTDLLEIDASTGAILRTWTAPNAEAAYNPTYTPAGLLVERVSWQGNIWVADAEW
jgi:hypothetical protein